MPIKKLPDNVIARIAAGEVITSPHSAIKEMLENSLDASSNLITIELNRKNTNFSIRDNGDGIAKEDLENLCLNHYTSKLDSFDVFKNNKEILDMSTFGFRGEALHSISICSHIKVTTNTDQSSETGYLATYSAGNMVDLKEVAFEGRGTLCEVKDIFYNSIARSSYFSNNKNSINTALEIIKSYGILFNSIECKIDGKVVLMLDQSIRNSNQLSNVEEVVENRKNYIWKNFIAETQRTNLENIKTYQNNNFIVICTDTMAKLKTKTFILFINKRLVRNTMLLNRVLQKYKKMAAKINPFIFIEIMTDKVDVNVNPEKAEVFIENTAIFDEIAEKIEELITTSEIYVISNSSISDKCLPLVQTHNTADTNTNERPLEPSFSDITSNKNDNELQTADEVKLSFEKRVPNSFGISDIKPLLLPDAVDISKIDFTPYLPIKEMCSFVSQLSSKANNKQETTDVYKIYSSPHRRRLDEHESISMSQIRKKFSLTSLKELQDSIQGDAMFFKSLVFVGEFNDFIFVQHLSNLIKIKKRIFLYEALYQKFVTDFGNFECMELSLPIQTSIPEEFYELLREYFSLVIEDGCIIAVPKIYEIDIEFDFAELNIVKVDEISTIKTICEQLAKIYCDLKVDTKLFNKIKTQVIATKEIIDNLSLLVDLKELYKSFDRC